VGAVHGGESATVPGGGRDLVATARERYAFDSPGSEGAVKVLKRVLIDKGCLVSTVDVLTPTGLQIHECKEFLKDGNRWVKPPEREWTDSVGKKRYAPMITFKDKATFENFQRQVLNAIDEHKGKS
jgi:hypothetical protein